MRLLLLLAAACSAARPAPASAGLESVARESFEVSGAAGLSIAVLRRGEPVLVAAWGLADVAQGVPMTPATRLYWIGPGQAARSALTMRAVEQGKLRLDEAIEVPGHTDCILVQQLADSTSGLADFHYLGDRYEQLVQTRRSADEVTAAFSVLPLQHAPGARWQWTVSGFHLLGVTLERRFALPLREAMRREVFGPAGVEADICDDTFLQRGLATGHTLEADGFQHSRPRQPSVWQYVGAATCGTASEAAKLARALRTGNVLQRASFDRMLELQPAARKDAKHGFGAGVEVSELQGHRFWGGFGATMGFGSALMDFPEDDLTVVVLSNTASQTGGIARRLAQAALGLTVAPPEKRAAPVMPAGAARASDASLAGVYHYAFVRGEPQHAVWRASVAITVLDGLYWQECGQSRQPLWKLPDGTYRVAGELDEVIRLTPASLELTTGDEVYAGARAADGAFCAAR